MEMQWDIAAVAFATFFATVGPVDVAAIFLAITPRMKAKAKRAMALKGVAIATAILLLFALVGDVVLNGLGISLAAFRTGGGILLLLIAVDMVFARSSGGVSTTSDEKAEAANKPDISVFPLATPLIAGPGAMGAAILLVADRQGDWAGGAMVIGALLAVMLLTLVLMLIAERVQRLLGVTGQHVIMRVAGVLLTALAVQFIFDGIRDSGLLNG